MTFRGLRGPSTTRLLWCLSGPFCDFSVFFSRLLHSFILGHGRSLCPCRPWLSLQEFSPGPRASGWNNANEGRRVVYKTASILTFRPYPFSFKVRLDHVGLHYGTFFGGYQFRTSRNPARTNSGLTYLILPVSLLIGLIRCYRWSSI